jgi:hypothetical protein
LVNAKAESASFGDQSWIKFNVQQKNTSTELNQRNIDELYDDYKKISYGNFHYFFNINTFPDTYFHNMLLACVTLRDNDIHNEASIFIDSITETNNEFDYRDHYFIDLSDVFPSNILTLAVDENYYPIRNRKKHANSYTDMNKYYSKEKDIKRLLFIELDPERKSIMK